MAALFDESAEQKLSSFFVQFSEEILGAAIAGARAQNLHPKFIDVIETHLLPALKNPSDAEGKQLLAEGCEKLMNDMCTGTGSLRALGAELYQMVPEFLKTTKDTFFPELMKKIFPLYADKLVDSFRSLDIPAQTMAGFLEMIAGWNEACTDNIWKIKV
jgi:hypothetical protein